MKNFIMFFILFSLCSISAFAEEAVFLNQEEVVQLKIPTSNPELSGIEHEDVLYNSREKSSNYFEAEEDVFESKFGKSFSKFIDKKLINNKINKFTEL